MINTLSFHVPRLEQMKAYPNELYYIGDTRLLSRRTISIIGTRRPNAYTKQFTHELSRRLSDQGVCIVSGGAMGVDAIAHAAAGNNNTIMVAATGLDQRYPAVNKKLIESIEKEGLVLSQFKEATPSNKYNFPKRNEVVVALGEVLIVTQADLNSGSMRSIEFALQMQRPIYVLPHRLDESEGTNFLLQEGHAKGIYNIEMFLSELGLGVSSVEDDPILEFCRLHPSYDEVVKQFGSKIFEYELMGKLTVKEGKVTLC